MNDRDHFAAAALTGLLACTPFDRAEKGKLFVADLAYKLADAMLRERERVAESPDPQHVAETCRGERQDTAPQPPAAGEQPVCWMVEWTDCQEFFTSLRVAERVADGDMAPQPLYRRPQSSGVTLTDAEREAVEFFSVICFGSPERRQHAATLSAMLARLGGGA